jgi:hypothetical protein
MYRTVLLGPYLFPAPVMPALDLLKMFMQLDESTHTVIASPVGISLDEARAICIDVLSYVALTQKAEAV